MTVDEKEVVKGRLLDHWISDLRQDRAPVPLPEMECLTQQEIVETLSLARWMAAVVAPTTVSISEADAVAAKVRARIHRERQQQQLALADLIKQATSFAGLIRTARHIRKLGIHELERALKLPMGTIESIEQAQYPPHRVPVVPMVALLRALRIATREVVTLIRAASVDWARRVYDQPATQLGRVDADLGVGHRYLLLAEANARDEPQRDLAEEVQRIEQFCLSVAAQLG